MAALLDLDELVEEILLRLPPEDPASLVCAALVCHRWRHLISSRGFRRRFRELHRTPPLLGFVGTRDGTNRLLAPPCFIPTSSFCPPRRSGELGGWVAIHSCHGRVLLYKPPRQHTDPRKNLLVWDLIKGEQRELPKLSWFPVPTFGWNAAVVCSSSAGTGCDDHFHCRRVSFLVIFVASLYNQTVTTIYSSDADAWSEPACAQERFRLQFFKATKAIAGNALYFNNSPSTELLKYDLTTRDVSAIHLPCQAFNKDIVLMAMEDSRLGFVTLYGSMLHMWSTEVGRPNSRDVRWEQSRVIELDTLLPADALSRETCLLAGCADGGEVILLWGSAGFLFIDLKSWRIKQGEGGRFCNFAVPVTSFCTPALGAACTDEGSGGDASSARKTQVPCAQCSES
ncbi:unnamed protein product [Urochloa decumbens]|uniref:F-box domain-containing protein n=1 Tax=Urochloa decumbens TaxID=240449 RepID=A0ABC9GB29_9POAL